MLTLDKKVTLHCTDTGNDATGTVVRIQGSRVDVMLDGGGNLLVSLSMQKPGLYVGSQSGLEFVMAVLIMSPGLTTPILKARARGRVGCRSGGVGRPVGMADLGWRHAGGDRRSALCRAQPGRRPRDRHHVRLHHRLGRSLPGTV